MSRAGIRCHSRQHDQVDHVYAVNRAEWQAKFTTRTIVDDDRVHALARTDDRVGRAIVEALRAADAGLFVNQRNALRTFVAAVRIERQWRSPQEHRQLRDQILPTGWAAIQGTLAPRQRLGIGTATVKSASTALGLRQQRIDAIRQHR